MVSGLVTSPCDQLRIFSGEARLMRIASKSAITFAISNGLERNKVFLRFLRSCATASGSQNQCLVPDSQLLSRTGWTLAFHAASRAHAAVADVSKIHQHCSAAA